MLEPRDLAGKTMLVTGANTGIGRATAVSLAHRGAHVFIACRSREKAEPVVAAIVAQGGNAEIVKLDLADLGSVRDAADAVLAKGQPLHVLVNNAGLAGMRGETTQGFEIAFGTNHLGHFALTERLLPRLRETGTSDAPARIINVSSKAHYDAKGIDWDALRRRTKTVTGLREYSVSKLANVLFTRALAAGKAGPKVRSYALHPGVVASDAWRHAPWPIRPILKMGLLTNEEGARTTLYCATADALKEQDGRYYDDCREKEPSALAHDDALRDELWKRSEAWAQIS
jgi:retinol dehydrogenase-12